MRSALALLSLTLTLSWGANWGKHGVVVRPGYKLRLAVLPVRCAIRITKLKDIESVFGPVANEEALVQERLKKAAEDITASIEAGLKLSTAIEPVPHDEVQDALRALGVELGSAPLSAREIQSLGERLRAQAILRVELSGYGKIKRKWLAWLIGSGVGEGAAQGAAAAAVANPWVGVAIAAEELAQEIVTWGGGAFLFNRVFTPVILEGRLFSVADGKMIWSKTALASLNRKALKTYPKKERKKKELRLRLTADKAIAELVKSLDKKTRKALR